MHGNEYEQSFLIKQLKELKLVMLCPTLESCCVIILLYIVLIKNEKKLNFITQVRFQNVKSKVVKYFYFVIQYDYGYSKLDKALQQECRALHVRNMFKYLSLLNRH